MTEGRQHSLFGGPFQGLDRWDAQANQNKRDDVERSREREHHAPAVTVVEQIADDLPEDYAPIAPPNPTNPATAPTVFFGKMSAGRIITSVDHDCCPK